MLIGDRVKIAKRCSIYGSPEYQLTLGSDTYIGMNCILNGYKAKLIIGKNVSIAQNVNIMVDSGPNASLAMQKVFPIQIGPVVIGDNCWIGASVIIMPNVSIGEFCVIAANSFVNRSFPPYSVVGGTPAKLLRTLAENEIDLLTDEL